MQPIRVLVVDDSRTVREHLADVLGGSPGMQVVGQAGDGKSAIEQCVQLRPDVITLDIALPEMSGLAVTEWVMAYHPTPILIISASVNRGNVFRAYDALTAGALDILEKPRADQSLPDWESDLVARVRLLSRIRVISHLRGRRAGRAGATNGSTPERPRPPADRPGAGLRLVALGASTGGPGAILTILRGLPPTFPLPLLIVLHLARAFAPGFLSWLSAQVAVPVSFAEDDMPIPDLGGLRVVLAPPDRHLVVRGGRLRLDDGPERHSCRPSVDALFDSLAREMGPAVLAGLLTGMGKDGAEGLAALRAAGAQTLAQDRESSVIFGMPGEAVRLDAACRVVALADIPGVLSAWARSAERRSS